MTLELWRMKVEFADHDRAADCLVPGEIERQFSPHRARIGSQRIEPRRKRWRKRCNKPGKLAERRRGRSKLQLSEQIGAIEIASTLQHHAIGLTDLQPV